MPIIRGKCRSFLKYSKRSSISRRCIWCHIWLLPALVYGKIRVKCISKYQLLRYVRIQGAIFNSSSEALIKGGLYWIIARPRFGPKAFFTLVSHIWMLDYSGHMIASEVYEKLNSGKSPLFARYAALYDQKRCT